MLPALVLLPLAALLRRPISIFLLLPAALAFILSYGPAFLPRSAPVTAQTGTHLRLLTYNLKSQTDSDPALTVIQSAQADVVALQELSTAMAAHLAAKLSDVYPYQALHPQPGEPIPGQGVLSRYPLLEDDYWRIQLAHQRVTFELDGPAVVLYNTHPVQPLHTNGFAHRHAEISDLLDRLEDETGPLLIAGDFNMSDQAADYGRLTARYQDAYRAAGWGMGFTFPATLPYFGSGRYAPSIFSLVPPLVRLDYVFHNAHFVTLHAEVGADAGGSDHLPLLVNLSLQTS
jgi:vancomycin resistance protein VanJ